MIGKRLLFLGLISLLCAAGSLRAQVEFLANTSENTVAQGERFTVEFTVNARGSNFKAPDFSGFRVLSGPNTSMSTYMDNSGTVFNITYSYILQANSPGQRTIGPAFIKVEGETYKTKALDIEITEKKEGSKKDDARDKARENIFVEAIVSRRKVYQGEPIYARYKLYFRNEIGQPRIIDEPDFGGFYKENIQQKRIETSAENVNGKRFTTGDLHRMVLIPQRSGNLTPGKLQLEVPTQIRTGRQDFFGRPVGKTIDLNIETTFPGLEVKPLPKQGRPADFSGGVGQFDFDVNVSTDELTTDESLNLTLSVEGTGNIKLLSLPEIEFPQAFEVFDPEEESNYQLGAHGMRGKKSADYLLVPRYSGTYKIGPISFSYFDPREGRYVTSKSKTFEIEVSGGRAAPKSSTDGGQISGGEKETVGFIGKEILFIKVNDLALREEGKTFWASTPFYLLLTLIAASCLAMILIYIWRRRGGSDRKLQRRQKAGKVARKHLAKARKALKSQDKTLFYQELTTALWGYFGDKLSIPKSQMSKDYIRQLLVEKNISTELQDEVLQMLNRAEMARYTAVGGNNPEEDYSQTTALLTQIEKEL